MVGVAERILARSDRHIAGFCLPNRALAELEARSGRFDAVLSDLKMPETSGLDVLQAVRDRWPSLPVIIMTGYSTIESAVAAMKLGAYDYIVKPFDPPDGLIAIVDRAVEHKRLRDRNLFLEKRLDIAARFEGIIGSSPPMREVFALIESVARSDATLLIVGESGTGKELVARAVHERSDRSQRAFVALNCGALTETVLESELFGHVKGAFTGAISSRRGLFEEASGGTLLLDEVGELTPRTQVRLLRVLQEGEIRPVGSSQSKAVDVRVIAATHRDLRRMVERGEFREDLYYRLNVILVPLPALRDRSEDIPSLARHFIEKHCALAERELLGVHPEALDRLVGHGWPGNVRELENVIERAVVLAQSDTITVDLLPLEVRKSSSAAASLGRSSLVEPSAVVETQLAFNDARNTFERRYLRTLLSATSGNSTEAARIAGVDRSNLRRLFKRHAIDPRTFR